MDVVRAVTSVSTDLDGAPVTISEGTLMPATHPLVVRLPRRFEPVAAFVARRYPQYADTDPADPGRKRRRTTGKPSS